MKNLKIGRVRYTEEQLTLFICMIVVFLAQISDKNHSNAVMMVGYLIALTWALVCRSPMLMGMNLFFLSDNSILDVGGVSIQLVIMCIYLLRFSVMRKRAFHGKTLLAGLVISGYSFIYIEHGFGYVLQGVKLAVMIIFLTEYLCERQALTRENYERQLGFAVLGIFFSVTAAICVNPSMLLASRFSLSEDSNWNLFGILSALLFSHSFVMYFVHKKKGQRYILYTLLMAICALLSTSRTALLIVILGTTWTLLFINENGTLVQKGIISIIIFIFILLLVNGIIHISFIDKLIDRIVNPRRGDISNGRFTLWLNYINYLKSHKNILIFGYGRTLIEGITTTTSSVSKMAHNMIIEQFTMYGVVGSGIVAALYGLSLSRIVKNLKANGNVPYFKIKYIITVLLVFVAGMFSHIITSVLVTMELYIGLMQYYVLNNRIRKKEEDEFNE